MTKIIEELRKWREARNMQDNEFVVEEQVAYMLDECKEILLAKTDEHRAEEYCDVAILAFNGLGLLKREYKSFDPSYVTQTIPDILRSLSYMIFEAVHWEDALSFIVLSCKNKIENLGYDFQNMMLEKIKVISSREQDPEQAKDWALKGASGTWEKNKAQSKDALYKPDKASEYKTNRVVCASFNTGGRKTT